MERTLRLGTAYHSNRILRHVEEDMRDVVNHHMNTVVHMFTHNDMDRHRSVMKDVISISEDKGLEVWVDNWGIDDGPGDKAYITALIPDAAQQFADGTRYFRPCFNHPDFRAFTRSWVDCVAEAGGKTLFWDEPHMNVSDVHGFACHCPTCRRLFEERYGKPMPAELTPEVAAFRTDTLIDYFRFATDYAHDCGMTNTGCIMFDPFYGISLDSIDRLLSLPHFDNVGCDPEVWNNHGSIVEFEGNWYVLYHRSTHASVTMRKACIEPIHFNEDGTIDEVEMTSQGAEGPLDAFAQVDAACACKLGGNVRITLADGSTDREILNSVRSGDSAEWRYLDFGRGARRIFLNLKSPEGGKVSVYADDVLLGECAVPACAGWTTLRARISRTRGVHALKLVFESEGGSDAFAVDWLRFSRRRWGRR